MNRHWLVRLAAQCIPHSYRDEIVADLQERHHGTLPLAFAIVRSARDARKQMRTRGTASGHWWTGLGSDLGGAWRQYRARPAHALAIITILTIALGLNTALFSMFEAVLIRPLPFRNAERVVFVWNQTPAGDDQPMAPARALDLRSRISAIEQGALIGHISMTVTGRGPAERWFGASVSSGFFDVLQSTPAIGRTFGASETNHDVVVLSHRLWTDQFQSDPAIIGQSLVMNGRPRTVVGVMPREFFWPSITAEISADGAPLFWTCAPPNDVPERPVPTEEDITLNRDMGYLRMVARLRDGSSIGAARAEAAAVGSQLATLYPQSDAGRAVHLVDAREQLLGPVRQPMLFVLLASGLLAIGACVNVGNLLLVRQAGRRRELAVRSALGANRWRLVRQLMAEALVLAMAGGLAGLGLAAMGLRALVAMAPPSVGRLDGAAIDGGVLAAAAIATAVSGVLLGLLSAMALWRDRSADDLRAAGSADRGRGRLRQALVVVQVALTVALLSGAMLFGQSLLRLQHVDVGFDTTNLLTFDVMLTGERAEYQTQQLDFFTQLLERVRAMPGVRSAGGAVTLPIGGDDFGASVFVEGRPLPPAGEEQRIGLQIVGDKWFDTLGMRLLEGRDFAITDTRASTRVVVVNKSLADIEWPGASPLGQLLRYGRSADAPIVTVIGVVSDIKHMGPGQPARPEIYLSYTQSSFPMMAIAVRTHADPLALVPAIRAEAARVDPTQPISGVATMESHLNRAYGRARFLSRLTIAFGGLALVLAIMGVYGVTSFAVAQRTKEFGVRTALGASRGRLMRDVVMKNLSAAVIGCAVGTGLAMWASRLIASLLFGTTPLDPSAYAGAVAVLLVTAACATAIPARRAATIDPVKALRDS